MPTINQLPTVTQVSGGDQLPLFVTNQGDARRCSVTTLIEYIQVNFGAVTCASVQTTPVRFDQLPNAVGNAGARAFITDGSSTTFAATVAGGGANKVPVYSDGTVWKVG
jgi:streptogramin lyase